MTTKDFFVIADKIFETTSQYNPASLGTNYFLHRWEIVSASRFVPAIMFTTRATEDQINITYSVASVAAPTILAAADGSVPTSVTRGGVIALNAVVTSTANPSDVPPPTAVLWSVSGNSSTRTYVTQTGVLHAGGDEVASSLTVTARAVYVDPDNPRLDEKTSTAAISVTGNMLPQWPESGAVLNSIRIKGVQVPGVVPGTTTYALTLPTGTTVAVKDVVAGLMNSAEVKTTVAKVAGGYTVTIVVDPSDPGNATTYTVNVTA